MPVPLTGLVVAAPIALVLVLVFANLGGGTTNASAGSAPRLVRVSITAAGCPASLELPSGRTRFVISNHGGPDVSELEVWRGVRILGEAENITPGLSGMFSLTRKPGSYWTNCPGGSRHSRGKLTVTG